LIIFAHPASYSVGSGGSFFGVKRPGHEADFYLLPNLRTSGSETASTFSLNTPTSHLSTHWWSAISIGHCCK